MAHLSSKKAKAIARLLSSLYHPKEKSRQEAIFPHKITDYQQHFLDNINIFNILYWGRRAGKDTISFYAMAKYALQKPGKYYYIFPCMRTGKSIITGFDQTLGGMSSFIPKNKIKRVYRSGGTIISLHNGSTIHLVGVGSSQQNRALRGDNINMAVLSEYAYYPRPEEVFNAIVPALTRTKGKLIIASTPRPGSHLVQLYEEMQDKKGWYISKVTQRDNHYLTEEEFEHASLGLTRSATELEFNCDCSIPDAHSVFYEQLVAKYVEEGEFQYYETPVYVGMDLGVTDSDTVFWWITKNNEKWILFDYFEGAGKPFQVYVHELQKRAKYLKYAKVFVPHDIVQKDFLSLQTRLGELHRTNLPLMRVPKTPVMDSIDRSRLFLEKNTVLFAEKCAPGLSHLKNYAYRDAMNTIPNLRSPHSHAADAFRYLADGIHFLNL